MEMPDSFDFRMVDRPAVDELQRVLARTDLAALAAMLAKGAARMRDPAFRRWPGRLAGLKWFESYHTSVLHFEEAAVRGDAETITDDPAGVAAVLTAAYTTPFFQTDYALLVRGTEWKNWVSTRRLTNDDTLVQIFRAIQEAPAGLEVKVEVPEPSSFLSLGYLDGGILRSIVADDRSALERLLSAATRVQYGYSDINWVAPASWLSELLTIVDAHSPSTGARGWVDHLQLLQHEAQTRDHGISIGGWYGKASALAPVSWERLRS
jgi:hypothetical protein